MAPISPGDLVDRIAILRLKADRIADAAQQANVLRELAALRQARDAASVRWELTADLED